MKIYILFNTVTFSLILYVAILLWRVLRAQKKILKTNPHTQKYSTASIPEVSLCEIDPIFKPNHLGTTLETEVHFMGRAGIHAEGAVSDSEAWILSVLAKKATNIFEFGTCTGRTTYLLAKNSPPEAQVTTLNLPLTSKENYKSNDRDDPKDIKIALSETQFSDYFYSNTPVESKINQILLDSKDFDETNLTNQCDLIFIDGSHAYSHVKSDSQKAFRMIKPGGIILWHDYSKSLCDVKGVDRALTEIAQDHQLFHIKTTLLVAYRKPQE